MQIDILYRQCQLCFGRFSRKPSLSCRPSIPKKFFKFFIQVKFSSCRGVGALLGIFSGGMLPDTPNPNLNTNQKMPFFHIRFQTRPLKSIPIFRPGLQEIVSSLPRLECQQKDFLKPILNLLITLSFLLILLF